jgi:uncharacterized protein (UPF0261 family)
VGTFDTKVEELTYIADCIRAAGVAVKTVDLSTQEAKTNADVAASVVAAAHPDGAAAVFTGDRGSAVTEMARMVSQTVPTGKNDKPAIGLTMFGVTTPCVQALTKELENTYDCLVFHATGVGGQSMEKLFESNMIEGVLDVTTTEVADHLMGGVFSAGEGRMDAIIRTKIPYVGSVGALDMVNFGAKETVPEKYAGRKLHIHNPQVTLMRTTPDENRQMGEWITKKLNKMEGPVRFLLPLGGVSVIDVPDMPFHDPAASEALFGTIRDIFNATPDRQLIEVDAAINDPKFVTAALDAFADVTKR